MRILTFLTAASVVLSAGSSSLARTWCITPDGTGDAPHIQAGIDSSSARDTLLLAPGAYRGDGNRDLDCHGKQVVILGEAGAPATVIDCEGSALDPHGGITFQSGESSATVLEGVTISGAWGRSGVACTGGSAPGIRECRFTGNHTDTGAALHLDASSPVVSDCVFEGNMAEVAGRVVLIREHCWPVFDRCTFSENSTAAGGAIYASGTYGAGINLTLTDCDFYGNTGEQGGALWFGWGQLNMNDCVASGNWAGWGGAVLLEHCTATVSGCVFSGNTSASHGGVFSIHQSSLTLDDCTLGYNSAGEGSAVSLFGEAAVHLAHTIIAHSPDGDALHDECGWCVDAMCTNIYGNAGGDWTGGLAQQLGSAGNFSADPLFCGPAVGDFRLDAASPCRPGQHPDGYPCGLIGARGMGCDGYYTEVTEGDSCPSTWGLVKSFFRLPGEE